MIWRSCSLGLSPITATLQGWDSMPDEVGAWKEQSRAVAGSCPQRAGCMAASQTFPSYPTVEPCSQELLHCPPAHSQPMSDFLLNKGACTDILRCWSKHQKLCGLSQGVIISQFQKREVQSQGVSLISELEYLLRAVRESIPYLSRGFWWCAGNHWCFLIYRIITSMSALHLYRDLSLCTCLCLQMFPLY